MKKYLLNLMAMLCESNLERYGDSPYLLLPAALSEGTYS